MTRATFQSMHHATPIGRLTLVGDERALVAVLWPDEPAGRVKVAHESVDGADAGAVLAATAEQLDEYFDGTRRDFDLPLEPVGTDFQCSVWRALADIPYGETSTYGRQATTIGRPRAARAVGAANGRNPLSIVLPCHRIVGADGALTGFAGGLEVKRWLLDHEAAHVAG